MRGPILKILASSARRKSIISSKIFILKNVTLRVMIVMSLQGEEEYDGDDDDNGDDDGDDDGDVRRVQREHYPCCRGAPRLEGFVHPAAPGIIDCFSVCQHHHRYQSLSILYL